MTSIKVLFLGLVWFVLIANLAGLAIDIYRAGWISRGEASDVVILVFLSWLAWGQSKKVRDG